MGDAGRPYARFKRALSTRDLLLIRAAALECPHIDLHDALTIIDLYREKDPRRLERACLRWLARYCTEKAATVEDVGLVSAAQPAERLHRELGLGVQQGHREGPSPPAFSGWERGRLSGLSSCG